LCVHQLYARTVARFECSDGSFWLHPGLIDTTSSGNFTMLCETCEAADRCANRRSPMSVVHIDYGTFMDIAAYIPRIRIIERAMVALVRLYVHVTRVNHSQYCGTSGHSITIGINQ